MLEASNITVRAGGCSIVANVSFKLKRGEIAGLIGPNGAGKSTLLKAVVGAGPLHAGEARLNGQLVSSYPPRERARHMAYLPQERRVEWRLPVRDVVLLGRYPHHAGFGGPTPACREAAARAMAQVGVEALADRPATTLSAGERARVLLARALAVEAPVLLADEPIAALDPRHQIHVMEILRERARAGDGVLVVLHDLPLAARFMDRLILISRGEVAADGAPEAVLSKDNLTSVYGVNALKGSENGEVWVLPWTRTLQEKT
jgi:iron complex transport system ATP-binding protein